ncbi:MAG: glycosyltransferase [Geobacteraceae bacterium]|nr:glycosyltransferase [Geobacteraceae bacterium]
MPTFSFVIPVKPGGYIAALTSLQQLDAGPCPFEILVAEGCSPSRQRNRAADKAQGEIIYFLDDDSRVAPDCLTLAAQAMEDRSIAVVGGPSLTPPDNSLLQQMFGRALSSLFGAGAVRNRYRAVGVSRETTDKELILCNLAIRRAVFLSVGGLDERLYPNEENELLDRIQDNGLKLVHEPRMTVHRSQRRTLRLFIRQMYSYGRGRAQQTLIAGPGTVIGFAPLFFLCYLTLLTVLPFAYIYLVPLCAYLVLDIIFALAAVMSSRSLLCFFLIFLFPLMHISNGVGLLTGLLGGKNGYAPPCKTEEPTVRVVKTFDQPIW